MSGEVLALIPARGGSKGIPRKNLLPVGGVPLIVHSVRQGLAAETITRVVVSTDDEEIAQVAREAGAEVPFLRPPALAGDLSPDLDAFSHALRWLEAEEGYLPELVVHLRPTCPARELRLIDAAVRKLQAAPEADSLRSVCLAQQTPFKMWREVGGRLVPVARVEGLPEAHSLARQQLPRVYWQNGYVDVIRPRTILELQSMAGEVVLPFEVDQRQFDLDYPEDVPAIEAALERLARGESLDSLPERHSV